LLCWVEIHCDIYRSSYNILNILYLRSVQLHAFTGHLYFVLWEFPV
jgi:hypothetical protein